MTSLFSTLVFTAALAQPVFASTGLNSGRCVPLDPTNPAYQVRCERFDQNPNGCETQRHICYWKSSSPYLPVDFSSVEQNMIAERF